MLTLVAGNDMEMGGGSPNYRKVPELIADGTLDPKILDRLSLTPSGHDQGL